MMFFLTCLLAMLSLSNASEPVPPQFKNQPLPKGIELQMQNLQCPFATRQYGLKWQDIKDCGMDHCMSQRRFGKTIEQCAEYCQSRRLEGGSIPNPAGPTQPRLGLGCTVFSWAPVGGDMNHPRDTVCTLHNRADTTINEDHGPNQIMCTIDPPPIVIDPCPAGTVQYGGKSEDIMNCGMDHCMNQRRFNKPTKEACAAYCQQRGCFVFSWAERGGDMNHPSTTVCTLHSWWDRWINEDHGPDQIMCRNLQVMPNDRTVYYAPGFRRSSLQAMIQNNAGFAAVGLLGLLSLFGGIAFYKYKGRTNYEEISAESTNLL